MKDIKYSLLINKASNQFAERGFECMLSVVLVLGTLMLLMFFPIAGIALAFIVAPFLCIGIKKYLLSIVKDEYMPVENIFLSYKVGLKAFCLKVAYTLISILWGIVFVIPGIITALNYSMASFIMAENPKLSALECMIKSKKMVNGNRLEIFIIYLCYAFVTVAISCIFVALGLAIINNTLVSAWLIIVLSILLFMFVLVIFVIPYFELMIANIYYTLIQNKTDKQKSIENKLSDQKAETKKLAKNNT